MGSGKAHRRRPDSTLRLEIIPRDLSPIKNPTDPVVLVVRTSLMTRHGVAELLINARTCVRLTSSRTWNHVPDSDGGRDAEFSYAPPFSRRRRSHPYSGSATYCTPRAPLTGCSGRFCGRK